MITFLFVSMGAALLAWCLSGARSLAYLLYFLAYVPFLTLDGEVGGLSELSDLSSSNAQFKLWVRVATSLGMLLLLVRRRDATRAILAGRSLPVLGFFVWALLGLPMSHSPWISLFRLGELFVFFLSGVALYLAGARRCGPREVARLHCLALLPLLIVALWSIAERPELAFHVNNMGQGRLGHKLLNANVLGFAAVILTLWATHELREATGARRRWSRERLMPLLVLALAIGVMFMARSRTALVTLTVGQLVLWLPVDRGNPRRRLMLIGLTLVALLWGVLEFEQILGWVLRDGSTADLLSGTGRTNLWKALLTKQVPRAPISGAGYLMLSDEGDFAYAGTWWSNAHNTYLFALVSTGLPGLVGILVIALFPLRMTFRRYLQAPPEERSSWTLILACQVVVLVSGVTGFGICGFPNPVMLFHYALYTWSVAPRSLPRPLARLRPVPAGLMLGGAR
jgi:O-antigen ligase